jgi:K+-sensing histidine kinase KdpD
MQNNDTKIIVCLDPESNSQTALRYAACIAKKSGFDIKILLVLPSEQRSLLFASKAMSQESKIIARKRLNKIIAGVNQEIAIKPQIKIIEGSVVQQITAEAQSQKDCVMMIFGKSANISSDNSVLPKIIQKVSNKIKVPVVIVPENLSQERLKDLCSDCS